MTTQPDNIPLIPATPNAFARYHGLKSMVQLLVLTGVPRVTLYRWWERRNKAFQLLVKGAAQKPREERV